MAWTDTITNTTKIRAVHITEIRSAIDSLASACATHNSTDNTGYNGTVKSNDSYDSYRSTYDSTQYSGNDSSRFGWNSSNNSNGLKGPCYLWLIRRRWTYGKIQRRYIPQ